MAEVQLHQIQPESRMKSLKRRFVKYWPLLLLVMIPLALVFIFNYAAYPGLRMVFMDYKPALGYEKSKWVGWGMFQKVFSNRDFFRALRNSLVFNILSLLISFPAPIVLALMLNELRYPKFKKVSQTILYLSHFLSWVIIGALAYSLFRPTTGIINVMMMNAGLIEKGIPFLTERTHWAVTYLLIGVWQGMGWEPAKEVVRRANEDYHLGITNPEYYVTDATTAEANFYSGKTYAYGAYIAPDMQLLNNFYAQNPDAELVAYTKMEDESVKLDMANEPIVRVDANYGMLIGFSSQATDDQIKAAMMYLEWMVQPENLFTLQWGFEGEHFNYVDGIPTIIANYEGDKPWAVNNNKDYWCAVVETRELSTFEEKMGANSPKGLPKDFTQEFLDMYALNCERYEKGYCVEDCKFAVSIEAENEYRGTLQALFTEYYDKLVMCDPDEFDALYDQYTQEYMDAGYREVIEQRAAAYDAGQSTHLPDNQKK